MTTSVKSWIAGLIDANRDRIAEDMAQLTPSERIKAITSLLPYIVAKQSEVSANVDFGKLSDETIDNIIDGLTQNLNDDDKGD